MRYRDQPTVQVEERIDADPEAIWGLVTDIALPARFSPELQRVEWLDGADGVAVGSRFRGHSQNEQLGEWTTDCEVVEVEPGRRWVWHVLVPDGVMATWGFEVDPGRSAVTVRQFGRMGPAPSGLNVAIDSMPEKESRIVSGRMVQWREAMAANLAGLKEMAEAPGD